MTMQKLLVVIVLLAIATGPRCSALAERQIQVPALKRIAQLGDLYNGNIDNLINVNVFSRQIPTEYISETQNPIKSTDVAITNSFEKQLKIFNTDANEAVNILTGMTPGRGAAGILNQKMKSSQLSGVLIYNYQTVVTSLWAFHEELKDLYNGDILGHIRATHVVTSITWGATVAVTLDASSTEIHDVRKTQNSLNKELRSLRGKLLPSDETDSNFSMSITSDVPLPNEFPTTAKEVKEILHQVPTLIAGINQGKGIPLQYTLTPINMIRKHLGVNIQNATVHKINEFTLSEIVQAFQDLHLAEDQIYEIKEHLNGHSNCVSPQTTATINGIISGFQIFKNNFTTTLKKSVVDVRSGLQETQKLSDLLENFRNSEFSLENLNHIFLNLSSTIEKIALCNTIQNEFSQIQYIGAGDDLISKLTTLQKSGNPVFVMFTNSEFIRNQPETYFESLNSLLGKQKEGADVNLLVNCDFSSSLLCNEPNDTVVFEYVNGTFSPSIQKREIKENIRVLDLEATASDIREEVLLNRQKFESILERLEQKLECVANPCLNSGKCTFENNERHCKCSAGFSGDNCETNIDDCAGHNSCLNGATCVDGTSKFSCACAPGFNGNHCETNIDDCAGHHRCLNGGTCIDNVNGFSCACLSGFIGNRCEHMNECVYPGTCASASRDARCKCREGYVQDPQDSRRCKPMNKSLNENATLIFGSSESIEQFSLKQGTVIQIQNQISDFWFALDFLYRTNTVFWSGDRKMINTAPIRPGASKTVVLNDPGASFLALAVDWVYGHLYFADNGRSTINVANLDGSMKKVLFTTGVTNTRAIVVDPLIGWIYWADYTAKNIERAGMDGTRREVIENSPKNLLGLALDLTQNRLYWTKLDHPASIHSMNVDGSDKKRVFQATQPTFPNSQFWSITTFGDFVYWRDTSTKAIYKTNKCGGGEATAVHSVADSEDSRQTLQAYHFSKQPEGVNYCANRIGGQCSHLCFPTPSNGNVSVTTKCACPDGRTLSSNQQTCT